MTCNSTEPDKLEVAKIQFQEDIKKTFMKESSNSNMTSNIFSLRRVQTNSCEQTFDRHFTPIARGLNEKTGFI